MGVSLAEELGYDAGQRLLIVNADDFGMCHSANVATAALLRERRISTATVMAPCPWVFEAAQLSREAGSFDLGVHLTFTSEWNGYRWGPVSPADAVPSLVDAYGTFPQMIREVFDRASGAEVAREARAQIDLLGELGIDVTHIDNHMFSLYGIRYGVLDEGGHLDVLLDLCQQYALPLRIPRYATGLAPDEPDLHARLEQRCAAHAERADRRGIVIPDYLRTSTYAVRPGDSFERTRADWWEIIDTLEPGVTELYIHPGTEGEEFAAISPDNAEKRVWEYRIFEDRELHERLEDRGVKMIGWRQLRDLQRSVTLRA